MDSVEFELSSWDGGVLVPYFSRISECFDVRIECENAVPRPRPSRDQPSPRCDELGPVEVGVEGGRTRLKLSANSEHCLLQAKAFIDGVTQQPQTEPYERHLTLSPDQFEALVGIHHGVQQETQTIFLFKHETYTVSILGQPSAVKMAQSLATQRILGCDTAEPSQGLPQMMPWVVTPSNGAQTHQKLSPTHQHKSRLQRRSGLKVNMGCWVTGGHGKNAEGEEIGGGEEDAGRMHALSLSPGAESAPDSCYDSDGSRSGSRRSSCTRSDSDLHTDVSRTVSDTLAAELLADTDPITTKDTTSENQLVPPTLPASINATRKLSVDNGSSNDTLVKQETQAFSISGAEAEGMLGTDTAAQVTAGLLAMSLDAATDSNTDGAPKESRVADHEEQEQEEDEQKVLYGIRLGYSQELTQRVLDKLGPDAGKDDLLQELIRHTEVEKDEEEDEEEEDKPVVCAWVRPSPTISSSVGDEEDVVDGRTQQQQPSRATGDLQAVSGKDNLRCIIIDGSNIAMSHGNKQVFSCRGIRLAVDYFRERGHTKVTVFVPSWRKEASRQDTQIVDQEILYELEKEGTLVFTPSRWVSGKRIVCYDDLYIIKLAAEDDGVVVSNDNYRDLINKSPEHKKVIEERLLMYSFVNDRFMPPDDPLGRHGPSLDNFLSKQPVVAEPLPPACPYGKKCTYGNKCKYYHPERGTTPRKSVVEVLQEKERVERAKVRSITQSRETSPGDIGSRGKSPTPSGPVKKTLTKTQSLVAGTKPGPAKKTLTRTRSLVPGAMGGAGIHSSAAVPPDFLPLKVKAEKQHIHTLTDDVATGCRVTVTTATPTDTTATTAASELSRKEYDERLSKYRREVEVAESGQQSKHELLSRKSSATNSGQSLESLQLPGSWSSGGASRVPDPLNQLRPRQPTHSDPQGDAFMTVGCGHLALAKKLSDEGKADEKRRNVQLGTTSAVDMGAHNSPPRQQQEEKIKKNNNGHRQLQRELSLQGSDDPRLVSKGSSRVPNSAQGGQKPKNKGPDVIFHGGSGPVHKSPYPHREQETMVHFGQPGSGVTCTFIGDRSEQQHQHHHPHLQHHQHQHQKHRPLVAMGRRHEIASHSQLQRHNSDGENLWTDRRYLLQQQQQGMRAPPERKQACRMASAPGTYPYLVAGSSGQGPQRRSSAVMPTIHRQNSTSDPQLHILQDNNSSHGNVLDTIMLGMYNPQSVHPGFGGYSGAPEQVNNNMMWAQSHSFDAPAGGGIKNNALFDGHLNLPGPAMDERMPRGGSFDGNLPGHLPTSTSFDNTVHPSGSYEDITANMKYAGLDGNMSSVHPFYQQHQQQHENPNKHSPEHKPYGSDQSLYMAGRMHMPGPGDNFGLPPTHMMTPRKSSPDIYNFLSQPSPPQPSPSAPQQQQGPLQSSQQDVYGGQMGHRLVKSISPVMMVGGDGRLASAPSPPHPDDQTPGNMPDLQTNRQKLFYHLTALFPEVEVREAMQRLPMETQPDKLVACIMTIRSLHSTA